MANYTHTKWPLGWTPSADALNGDPNGLLRMDNLQQEKDGHLSLVRGIRKLNTAEFSNFVYNIHSKVINATEYIWVGLGLGTSVQRSSNAGASFTEIMTGGGGRVAFGEAFGSILISSGSQKKKDNGTTVTDLGITTPTSAPTIGAINQPSVDLSGGTYVAVEGTLQASLGNGARIAIDEVTLRAVLKNTLDGETDTLNIGGAGQSDTPDFDLFSWLVQPDDLASFSVFRIEILLDDENYYWHEWSTGDENSFLVGRNTQSTLRAYRKDFTREGSNTNLDWSNVTAIRYVATAITNSDTDFVAAEAKFTGGAQGQLNGSYEYITINVANNGFYLAKSGPSPKSELVNVINGRVSIIPQTSADPQVTEQWIFRRGGDLPLFYRVAISTGTVDDSLSDVEALRLNIQLNRFLISIKDLPEQIVGIEGLCAERMLYITPTSLVLSDRLNPDAYDERFVFKVSGDPTETLLWVKKVNNGIIVASTKEFYAIEGTLLDNPDNSMDISLRGIGESHPPLSDAIASDESYIYYVASDGVRFTNGGASQSYSSQLRQLFQGVACHGVPAISIIANNVIRYPITIGHGKLYFAALLTDGTRRLFIFDIVNKTYTLRFTDPIALHTTPNDRVLAGYGGGSGNFLRELEYGTQVDGVEGQSIFFQTVFDANTQPRNRKDTFTLKVSCNTGGKIVSVYLAKDANPAAIDSSWVFMGDISTTSPLDTFFKLDGVTLGFKYAIKIVAADGELEVFDLYEITIEYEPRPEQLNYFRIPNTNLGTISRKRFVAYAFVIDTLGNSVSFTPYVDNGAVLASTVLKTGKLTYIHYFLIETIGTDIGGILNGGPFEFYQLNLEETISEKLPTPTKFLVIPSNDYGSPNRKRHTSYKFQIHSRGANVRFTPRLDGTNYTASIVNTSEKRTHEHYFPLADGDVIGVDIGGVLESIADTPFEFYGVIVPQQLEILPAKLKSFYLPENNFGVAARKRIRTIPIIINTFGSDVTFTPVVDNVNGTPQILNTPRKQTTLYYFTTDSFGIDYSGFLEGTQPFEFYQWGELENVETLPVGKRYDQLGPMRFDKIGKLFTMRTRLISTGDTVIPFTIYGEESLSVVTYGTELYSGSLDVVAGLDNIYEFQFPKNVNTQIARITLGPTTSPFHRYDMQLRVSTSGMESDSRWVPLR